LLLLEPSPPPAKLEEADRLLQLVLSQRPAMQPTADYWRAIAHTHARALDTAAVELEHILDPADYGHDNPHRRTILLRAGERALLLHDELRRRVGEPQLAQPGRRMEAIAAVERHLAENTEDQMAWNLKRLLYHDVTEAEYNAAAGGTEQAFAAFDHAYAQQ